MLAEADFNFGNAAHQDPAPIPPGLRNFLVNDSIDLMKTQVVKSNRHWLTTQAIPDIEEHLRALRDEFTGQPEIAFYHAALIVKIRRRVELAENVRAFRALWGSEGFDLLKILSSRWIISALDTFVDHGEGAEPATAMSIVAFINMLKMADTEYRLYGSPAYDPKKLKENKDDYTPLWDGLRTFHLPDDDTFANTIRRMRKTLSRVPLFLFMFETVLNKAVSQNSILNRMAQHHMRHLL
jgi:hypothetical protein